MHLPSNAILFLSKQELAFKSYSKSTDLLNKGNFKEFKLLVDTSPIEIKQQYEKVQQ